MKKIVLVLAFLINFFFGYSQSPDKIIKMDKDTTKFGNTTNGFIYNIVSWTDTTIAGANVQYRLYKSMSATQSIRDAINGGFAKIIGNSANIDTTGLYHSNRTALNAVLGVNTGDTVGHGVINYNIGLKLNKTDTSNMLLPYLRKSDTTSLSNRINLKLNSSDTASMLLPYFRKGDTIYVYNYINSKMYYNVTDSTKLAGIQSGAEVNVQADWNATSGDSLIRNKPNISQIVHDSIGNIGLEEVTDNDSVTTHGATFGNVVNFKDKIYILQTKPSIEGIRVLTTGINSFGLNLITQNYGSYPIYFNSTLCDTLLYGQKNGELKLLFRGDGAIVSKDLTSSQIISHGDKAFTNLELVKQLVSDSMPTVDTTGLYHSNRTALDAVSGTNTGDTVGHGVINSNILNKVDKVTGKELSDNNYTDSDSLALLNLPSNLGAKVDSSVLNDSLLTKIPYSGASQNIDFNNKNVSNIDTTFTKTLKIYDTDNLSYGEIKATDGTITGYNSLNQRTFISGDDYFAMRGIGDYYATINNSNLTGDRNISTPNKSGTIALLSDITDSIGKKLDSTIFWEQNDITKEPTGFTNSENITVTYDTLNRTITLTGTFEAYYRGKLVSILTNGWTSSAHGTTINKTYFLRYNDSGFVFDTVVWNFYDLMIASCQYNSLTKIGLRETHGFQQWETHQSEHETEGTYLQSGADLSDYTPNSTTATDRRPVVSATYIKDEDLKSTVSLLSTKLYTQRYLVGTTRTFTTGAAEIVPVSGNRPYWNQNTGGTWGQTLFNGNEYGAIFLVAIPATADNSSQVYRYMWVQPQQVSTTLSTIQALTPNNLTHGEAASLVSEYVFISKIIIRYIAGGTDNWSIISVEKLTGNRMQQIALSVSSSYLTTVNTDGTTIDGNGTTLSPLNVDTTNIISITRLNDTLTKSNQIITRGFNSITTNDTLFPTGNYGQNEYYVTALAENTLVLAPSGTAFNGNVLMIRITPDATPRNLTWNAIYTSFAVTLPVITIASKSIIAGFIYNSTSSKWECASVINQL